MAKSSPPASVSSTPTPQKIAEPPRVAAVISTNPPITSSGSPIEIGTLTP